MPTMVRRHRPVRSSALPLAHRSSVCLRLSFWSVRPSTHQSADQAWHDEQRERDPELCVCDRDGIRRMKARGPWTGGGGGRHYLERGGSGEGGQDRGS